MTIPHGQDKLKQYFHVLLFAGLLFWQAVFFVLDEDKNPSWINYLRALAMFAALQLPVLFFAVIKNHWRERLPRKKYRLYWLFGYGVVFPLWVIVAMLLLPGGYTQGFLFMAALSAIGLELLLEANTYYQQRSADFRRVREFDLGKAILVVITILAILLSAMAVSCIGTPGYYNKHGHLLVHYELSIPLLLQYRDIFVSLSGQLLLCYLCGYLFFYINSRFLVSEVLRKRGLLLYVLSGLALAALLYPLLSQLILWLPMRYLLGDTLSDNAFHLEHAFIAIGIIVLSLPIVLAMQWSRQNNQILLLEKEKTQAELDLLKQQLNPHFFFNTLNNLYALSLQQSSQTPQSILRLSDLMRYVIYKGKEDRVALKDEIKYLEDYLQLQQMRLRRQPELSFEKKIGSGLQLIAPLLLVIFVENAFKHGIEPAEDRASLHLYLQCDDTRLYFRCENSFEPEEGQEVGIGLSNLARRLELLYPGKHTLLTVSENHIFKAELQLDLL